MQRLVILLAALLLAAPVLSLVLEEPAISSVPEAEAIRPPAALVDPASAPEPAATRALGDAGFRMVGEDSLYARAAEVAWRYVESQYQPTTGLANSVIQYPYATIWDIGSTLAAYHSAHELGLMSDEVFDARITRALRTLAEVPLFADGGFNKNYQVARGVAAGRNDREAAAGYGWSATDIGRLLVWLRVIATAHPEHAGAAERVVDRLAIDRLVRDGYLWGEDLDASGRRRRYQEGRLGYEQYAAAGFALWGAFADRALSVRENATEVDVLGIPLLADRREGAHLTSEPFVLMGLEIGWWSPHWRELAEAVLAAQQARFERTGQVTIVSEDAVPLAPHFFYYYTIHDDGEDFAVVSLNTTEPLPGPRWISAKAAFGWYAISPSPYTWRSLQSVSAAADPAIGWSSGIFEQSGRPTGGQNINTAAVILESALYHRVGRPILAAASLRVDSAQALTPQ